MNNSNALYKIIINYYADNNHSPLLFLKVKTNAQLQKLGKHKMLPSKMPVSTDNLEYQRLPCCHHTEESNTYSCL